MDMPLIRLPKIRRKQSSAAGGRGEGDAASLASAMSASSNSIKSLGLAGEFQYLKYNLLWQGRSKL